MTSRGELLLSELPVIDFPMFLFVKPNCENFSFRKRQTTVIPNPAIPNCTPAFSNNLGIMEILLSVTKLVE